MRETRAWWTMMAWALLLPAGVSAQFGDPEAGDTGGWTPPAAPQQPAPEQPAPQQPAPQQPAPPPPPSQQQPSWFQQDREQPPALGGKPQGAAQQAEADTDHGKVVGALGFQYFGRHPIAFVQPDGSDASRVNAAGVGIRYWLSDSLGLDIGARIGYAAPNADANDAFLRGFSAIALGLQVGLPIVLQAYDHLSFLVIPEASFMFGSLSFQGEEASQDWSGSSIAFNLGARAGAEVQFGFWGIPQLSVQMTVGAGLGYEQQSAEMLDDPSVNANRSQTSFFTDADDLFEGTVRVVYYLP